VHGLLTTCAARIPVGALLFDAVSRRQTLRLRRGRGPLFGYVVPVLSRLPRLRDGLLSIMLARLGR
jgi:hypothetical protein